MIFAIRSISPLILALLLLVKLVLRVPLPRTSFWLDGGGASGDDQGGTGAASKPRTPLAAEAGVGAVPGGAAAAEGLGKDAAAVAADASAAAGAAGPAAEPAAATAADDITHADISVHLPAAGKPPAAAAADGEAGSARDEEEGGGGACGWRGAGGARARACWAGAAAALRELLPLLIGMAMCQVGGGVRMQIETATGFALGLGGQQSSRSENRT